MNKCKKCGKRIKRNEEAYIDRRLVCQKCFDIIKFTPSTKKWIPNWLEGIIIKQKDLKSIKVCVLYEKRGYKVQENKTTNL